MNKVINVILMTLWITLTQFSRTVLNRHSKLQRNPSVDVNEHNNPGLMMNANINGMNIILNANVIIL